jgi:pyruvate kinase
MANDPTTQPEALASPSRGDEGPRGWNPVLAEGLIEQLTEIRGAMLALEEEAGSLDHLPPSHRESARNLLHYLGLRRHDARQVQRDLATLGLSSLGRAESHVLASVDSVLDILLYVAGRPGAAATRERPTLSQAAGERILEARAEALLGPRPHSRTVRIMVTVPREAAEDYLLVREMLDRGMDCMRINCAHDDASAWERMVGNLRRAERDLGRSCRVLMDLGGPKLRTGAVEPGPGVLKWRPERDERGRVTAPARIWLTPAERPLSPPSADAACLPVTGAWLATVRAGDHVLLTDARGKLRRLRVVHEVEESRWAEAERTAYVVADLPLRRQPGGEEGGPPPEPAEGRVGALSPRERAIVLREGDPLILTADQGPGRPAAVDDRGRLLTAATLPCTLPAVFQDVRPGERIWLDDGKIGGVVEAVSEHRLALRVTQSPPRGGRLRADKGINLPDSELRLAALTPKDQEDLTFVAAHADMVGLSFVHDPADVHELARRLADLGRSDLGVVLKIETRRAFDELPKLLLAALHTARPGVMIARGDLAVECGYERLAEVQEEILWICETAHVPVIWATQVLENLAKEGVPSRAEITDAAMGVRAECVMLNKGPHIREAIRVLDHILRRMQAHQSKKRSLLRELRVARLF